MQVVIAQAPVQQVEPALGSAVQAWPQEPQSAAVVLRLVSQPLLATPSQFPKPAVQDTTVQALDTQPSVVTLASAQTCPHEPQLAGSLAVLAQKAVAPLPQVTSGDAHVVPQTPPEHTWPVAQAWPQAPQLLPSI